MTRALPKNITSYDLLKTLAVILMIVDHLGSFSFVDSQWTRVFGRMCVPMWFFLIGYAHTRDVPLKLWVGAVILFLVNVVVGMEMFPLGILATMIVVRFTIDRVADLYFKNRWAFYTVLSIFFVICLPSYTILEYGTQGMLFALIGYFVRNREKLNDPNFINAYLIFAGLTYLLCQQLWFNFEQPQFIVLAVGVFGVCYGLTQFKPMEFDCTLPSLVKAALKLTGRYTLEIYVVHLVVFNFIALYIGVEGFGLFEMDIINLSMFFPE